MWVGSAIQSGGGASIGSNIDFLSPIGCRYGPAPRPDLPRRRAGALLLAGGTALALSQPSVSNQVAALEREIGVRLLARRPGGLGLTPRARPCSCTPMPSPIASGWPNPAGGRAPGAATRLRIGALPSALAGLVPEAIARVRVTAPRHESVRRGNGRRPGGPPRLRRAPPRHRLPGQHLPAPHPPGQTPPPAPRGVHGRASSRPPARGEPKSTSPTCATTTGPPRGLTG